MLIFEVLEYDVRYKGKRRTYWGTAALAKEFVRATYGADVEIRPYHSEGPAGAFCFGRDHHGDDAGLIKATWVWGHVPTSTEQERLRRLIRWYNEDGEERLVQHLVELRGEDTDEDNSVESFQAVAPERGTALIKAILLLESKLDYCGSCPGRNGEHKMSCAKTKGRITLSVNFKN